MNNDTKLAALGLSTRVLNCIHNYNRDCRPDEVKITTVGHIRKMSNAELLRMPNFGRACLVELREAAGGDPPEPMRLAQSHFVKTDLLLEARGIMESDLTSDKGLSKRWDEHSANRDWTDYDKIIAYMIWARIG